MAINPQDKRIFGGQSDVNQLMPFKHKWAYDAYLEANKHHWLPGHIQFDLDLKSGFYHTLLSRNAFLALELYLSWKYVTSWFCREILPTIYRNTTSPECRQFFLRMVQEESVAIAAIDSVPMPTIQQPAITDEQGWRTRMLGLCYAPIQDFLKDDMQPHDYAAVTAFVLQLKGYVLVGLETYLTKDCQLPEEMRKLVKKLEADAIRQRTFLTKLMCTFLIEQPQMAEFTLACMKSSVLSSYHHHWFAGDVALPDNSIKFAEYVLNTTIGATGLNVPNMPSPYAKVVVEKTTTSSSLNWE